MENKKAFSDIFRVTVSNILKLASGVLVGFLLPKIIGVTDYGYYKTFTLYVTYIGLFHLGINDGIYLYFGGKEYEELNKPKFRTYFFILVSIEIAISFLIILISIFVLDGELKFIFISLSIFLIFNNITAYYQYISQATRRFTELSFRNVIQSIFIAIGVLACAFFYYKLGFHITYRHFTVIYIIIFGFLMIWYIYTYREISFGEKVVLKEGFNDIKEFIKLGLPLMISNLCSSLILNLDRQFVSTLYNTDTYAIYAFAYNMLALITTATSAIAVVLYPNLKRMDESTLRKNMDRLIQAVMIIVYCGLVVYFPLCKFVLWFLPQYAESLFIFRIIFPGLAISSSITIVIHNYYKTIGQNLLFFKQSLIVLLISGIFNYIAYRLFDTTAAISWASIIVMVFWFFVSESYFIKRFSIPWKRTSIYMIIMMLSFYVITYFDNLVVAFIVYIIAFVVITYVLLNKTIKSFLKKIPKNL